MKRSYDSPNGCNCNDSSDGDDEPVVRRAAPVFCGRIVPNEESRLCPALTSHAVEVAPGVENFMGLMSALQHAVVPGFGAEPGPGRGATITELESGEEPEPSHRAALDAALLPPAPGADDLGEESDDDDDDDDDLDEESDDAGSLADFVVPDAGMPRAAAAALAPLRERYGHERRDCFRALLYYVARCTLDRAYVRRVSDSTSGVELGRQAANMWRLPAERASALVRSEAWSAELVTQLQQHCLAAVRDEANAGGLTCRACKLPYRRVSRRIILMGLGTPGQAPEDYDGTQLYADVRAMEQLHADGSGGDDVPVARQPMVSVPTGRQCAERTMRYHALVHFWQMCGWRCYKVLGPTGGKRVAGLTPRQRALRVMEGKEEVLERHCWAEFVRVVGDAEAAHTEDQ